MVLDLRSYLPAAFISSSDCLARIRSLTEGPMLPSAIYQSNNAGAMTVDHTRPEGVYQHEP